MDFKELETKLQPVEELKEQLTKKLKSWYENDAANCDTKEFGEITDIIKDLAEVKSKCWEAAYYELVARAMCEKREDMMTARNARMGYPMPMMEPEMWAQRSPDRFGDIRTGYGENVLPTHHETTQSEYGRPYTEFQQARRNYTATNQPKDKAEMDHHALEHLDQTVTTMRDIWKSASPEHRKKMKMELQTLLTEMNV